MKKVFALVLAVAMLMSVALAEIPSPPVFSVISVDPDTVTVGVDADSETAKQLVTDIEAVGMDEAFGSVLDVPVEHTLVALADITMSGFEDADGQVTVKIFVPGVTSESDVKVLLGLLDAEVVNWEALEVVGVEDGIVTIVITADQADAVQAGSAVIAVLAK